MRLFKKICFALIAVLLFLPAIGAVFPQIAGQEGTVIPLGVVSVYGSEGAYTLNVEQGSWAEYLVQPLFAEDVNEGVTGAVLGVLYALQQSGVVLSTPMVWAVGMFMLIIVVELLDVVTSLLMWIPRRIRDTFERS